MDDHLLDSAFQRKYLPHWLVAGGILLLLIAAFVWWTQVYENPYNVYWDMLASSLATSSDTKHIVENSNGTRLNQYISQQFGASSIAYGRTVLSNAASTVTTESYGTMTHDYVRYTGIKTKQKNKVGTTPDFSKVLNKWAQAPVSNVAAQSNSSSTPFLTQTILGLGGGNLIPIADLSPAQRQNLLTQLHQDVVFDTSFNNVQKQKLKGRSVYVYTVNVEPVAYVGFEKSFAADLGLHTLDNIDPNSYQGQQPIQVELSVDVLSHHLVEINYGSSQHQEYYASYGVPINVATPKATISEQTLQSLVSQAQ